MEVFLKNIFRSLSLLFLISGFVILLDQLTKKIVRSQLQFGETWMPLDWLAPYFRFVYWHNSGAAFGMAQNLSLVFTLLAILVAFAILLYYPQIPMEDWPLRIALALQFGGAIGNLIDRLTIGFVTDFISVGNFPVFNVADSSITIGVVVLIGGMWIMEKKQQSNLQDVTKSQNPRNATIPDEEI